MDNPLFGDPSQGEMDTTAISMHEIYASYIRAGFTDAQAFEITLLTIKLAFEQQRRH